MQTKYYLIENRETLAKMSFDGANYFDAFFLVNNDWKKGFPAELIFEGVEITADDAKKFLNGKIDSFDIIPAYRK